MKKIWSTIGGYLWWTYPRGSVHYDVMVTLILVFIFLAPLRVNFKDKPLERAPHPTRVVIVPDGAGGFVYRVEATAVHGSNDAEVRESLLQIIEPIAGEVQLTRWEAVKDNRGHTNEYKAWVAARP